MRTQAQRLSAASQRATEAFKLTSTYDRDEILKARIEITETNMLFRSQWFGASVVWAEDDVGWVRALEIVNDDSVVSFFVRLMGAGRDDYADVTPAEQCDRLISQISMLGYSRFDLPPMHEVKAYVSDLANWTAEVQPMFCQSDMVQLKLNMLRVVSPSEMFDISMKVVSRCILKWS